MRTRIEINNSVRADSRPVREILEVLLDVRDLLQSEQNIRNGMGTVNALTPQGGSDYQLDKKTKTSGEA